MRTPSRLLPLAALVSAIGLLTTGCEEKVQPRATTSIFGHETTFTADPENANAAAVARSVTERLHGQLAGFLSVYKEDSDVSNVNRFAGERYWPVSRDTSRILYLARQYAEMTDGAFSFTLGPVQYRWGFTGEIVLEKPIPAELLRATLAGTEPENVLLDATMVRLKNPMTRIDLGELQASYCLDLAIIRLREMEAKDALVDLGVMARGLRRNASLPPWSVEISHPFDPARTAGSVELVNGLAYARVTTHDKTITIQGKTYHNYLDPTTGLPATGIAAAYVLAPTATMAQALAQGLLVGGLEKAPDMIGRFDYRVEAMLIPDSKTGDAYMTPGFQNLYFPDTNETWTVHDLIREDPFQVDEAGI